MAIFSNFTDLTEGQTWEVTADVLRPHNDGLPGLNPGDTLRLYMEGFNGSVWNTEDFEGGGEDAYGSYVTGTIEDDLTVRFRVPTLVNTDGAIINDELELMEARVYRFYENTGEREGIPGVYGTTLEINDAGDTPVEPPVFRITQNSPTGDEETVAEWFTITGENLVEGEEYKFLLNGQFEIRLTSDFPVYQEGTIGPSFNVDGDTTIPLSISRGSTADSFTVYDINGVELPAGYSADFDFTIIDADGSGDPEPPAFYITQDSPSGVEGTSATIFTVTGENLVEGEEYALFVSGREVLFTSESNVYSVTTEVGGVDNGLGMVDEDVTVTAGVTRKSTTATFDLFNLDGSLVGVGEQAEVPFTILDTVVETGGDDGGSSDGGGDDGGGVPASNVDIYEPTDQIDLGSFTPQPELASDQIDLSGLDLTGLDFEEVATPAPVVEAEPFWMVPLSKRTSDFDESLFELVEDPDFIDARGRKVRGTGDDDFITGNRKDNNLIGRTGDDFLRGGRGDDRIKAGSGNDFILDGKGDDLIIDGGGDDFIVLGSGEDIVKLGSGDNIIVGFNSDQDELRAKGGIEWMSTDQGMFGTYDAGTVALF